MYASMARYLVKFSKIREAKYISHLDTMRTIHRAFRRAELPISYSKGFNPHASISVASPLSLGISSVAEYADVDLDEEVNNSEFKDALNEVLPSGIRILNVLLIKEKSVPSMAAVEGACYEIKLSADIDEAEIQNIIKKVMDSKEIIRMKRTKSGEKETDIRPFVKDVKLLEAGDNGILFETRVLSGSRGNLNPELLADVIKDFSEGHISGYPVIERKELYKIENDEWISLYKYFAGK